MAKIERILVPIDFSDYSHGALDYAANLAEATGAKIHLLHAYHLPVQLASLGEVMIPQDFWTAVRDAATQKIQALAKQLEDRGISGETELIEENPARAIVRHAETIEADLIVMGTQGLSGIKRLMLGSVAARTLRLAPCPVLTVPKDAAVAGKFQLARILVPMDFSPSAHAALELAKNFAKLVTPVHLILVHGYYIPVEIEALALHEGSVVLEQLSTGAEKGLAAMFAELQDQGISAEYLADHGSPERVIVEMAKRSEVDLIVMGTHGRTGFVHATLGSVAERVVQNSPYPILTTKVRE